MDRPMEDAELQSILTSAIAESHGLGEGPLANWRRRAMRYYHGEPFGNETEGRSQVVSRDVAHAVESLIPSLVRIFTAGDEVVKFEPTGPEDEDAAQQATDYVNWIWNQQNEGFRNFYTWFKDALLLRNGVMKIWWEEKTDYGTESYEGLTSAQIDMVKADPDVQILARRPSAVSGAFLGPAVPPTPEPVAGIAGDQASIAFDQLFDIDIRRAVRHEQVRIAPIPPEEFVIARAAVALEDKPFCAHRAYRTVSDLVAMGYDRKILEEAADASHSAEPERRDREMRTGSFSLHTLPTDRSLRRVLVTEAYLQVDYDGDGIAEYRMIRAIGENCSTILENKEVDDNPFAALTPILLPHTFFGQSIADQAMDMQLIKSTLWRQMLDNLYLSNNPEKEVVATEVNIEDLLTSRPGGLKRVKQPGMIRVLETPFTAGASFPMLEYVDSMLEQRTGITKYNQGLDSNALNRTATGVNIIANAGQQRPELIARVFAETGVKRAFRLILRLICEHQRQARVVRLRNRWVEMDPRGWNHRMDLSVTVGLGTGNKDQKLAHLAMIASKQEQILLQAGHDNPLVSLTNYYNTLRRMVENADLKSPDLYFSNPADHPPFPFASSPSDELNDEDHAKDLAVAKLALDRQKAEADAKIAAARLAQEDERMRQGFALRRLELTKATALLRARRAKQKESADVSKGYGEKKIGA